MDTILTGQEAREAFRKIMDTEPVKGNYIEPYIAGYFKSDDYYIAFDNTHGEFYVEEFITEECAYKYCLDYNYEDLHIDERKWMNSTLKWRYRWSLILTQSKMIREYLKRMPIMRRLKKNTTSM